MELNDVLQDIANRHGLDADRLVTYAAEDTLGGWTGSGEWIGSIWPDEGRLLYTLVRHEKPERVYDLGTSKGVSAAHIMAALRVNGTGHLVTVDINPVTRDGYEVGCFIPDDLREWGSLIIADARHYALEECDFIFEDTNHDADMVRDLALAAMDALRTGGFCVHHDALHYVIGDNVRQGLIDAGVQYDAYAIGPDVGANVCGMAIWRQS